MHHRTCWSLLLTVVPAPAISHFSVSTLGCESSTRDASPYDTVLGTFEPLKRPRKTMIDLNTAACAMQRIYIRPLCLSFWQPLAPWAFLSCFSPPSLSFLLCLLLLPINKRAPVGRVSWPIKRWQRFSSGGPRFWVRSDPYQE